MAYDLEILVVAAQHQQLFEQLRRLRQGVERPRGNPARDQVIARALGRRTRHERRLDFEEALAMQGLR